MNNVYWNTLLPRNCWYAGEISIRCEKNFESTVFLGCPLFIASLLQRLHSLFRYCMWRCPPLPLSSNSTWLQLLVPSPVLTICTKAPCIKGRGTLVMTMSHDAGSRKRVKGSSYLGKKPKNKNQTKQKNQIGLHSVKSVWMPLNFPPRPPSVKEASVCFSHE